MLVYEVHLNGKKLCTAGVGEPGVLTTIVTWVLHDGSGRPEGQEELGIQVGGLISRTQENLDWLDRPLQRGDEITIRIAEADRVDKPKTLRGPETAAQRRRRQQAYVREMAKQFGWTIKTK